MILRNPCWLYLEKCDSTDFEPVPVPKNQYNNFYSGDSYIVLKTTEIKNRMIWDIHFWLGASTSQDEAGAAAILTVNLDDFKFQGAAVQHREQQGYESQQFLHYFQPAIRYLDGGHASGFSHVTINAGSEKRLFQIKGKKHVRVRQVEPKISSMNKGDCFILDIEHTIYLYVGEKAGQMEKMKAISVANTIRDQDHNGRGSVEIIDPYSSEKDFETFFEALGSGDRASVPEDTEGGDDEEFERKAEASLSEVSDSSGQVKISPLPKPYSQGQLKSEECYILDLGRSGIYVWVGSKSNEKEKSEAMKKAQQYLKTQNLPEWVHVSKVPEGAEPAAFTQFFENWQD
ncbi:gelsolin-like isoform X2 [Pectinophora gossypiella]|uniref:gelsolin-like isoform X2 n=1 Tax=Pectinophora gossypiella TaxID=13191 RepID=UPI00214E657C|nr:gelsolin-like isoform X2 [Pectinophora gossypiella]